MNELYANINGIKICYEIYGNGFPLILIHGYSGRKENWFAQINALSEKFKTITFDNRSAGKSDHPNKPITMQMFADDVKGLMDFIEIEKAHVAGASLGGMIAQQFVLSYPERVNKLILINSHYNGDMGEIIMKSQLESLETKDQNPIKNFWRGTFFIYHQKFRRQMKANPKKKFYDLFSVEDLIKKSLESPLISEDLVNQAHAFKGFNIFKRLEEIKNPTLLIAASHDRILPNFQMKEMNKKIPDSRFIIIDKAGHGSTVSRAPEINKIILDFLKN